MHLHLQVSFFFRHLRANILVEINLENYAFIQLAHLMLKTSNKTYCAISCFSHRLLFKINILEEILS